MESSPTSNSRKTSTSPLGQRPLSLSHELATPSSVIAEFGDEADMAVPSALELAENVGQSYRRSRHVPQSTSTRANHDGRDRSRDRGPTASSPRDFLVAIQDNLPPKSSRTREALPVDEILRSFIKVAAPQARPQSNDDRAAEERHLYLCVLALLAENRELKDELTSMQQRFT